jgi:hypothetical protein
MTDADRRAEGGGLAQFVRGCVEVGGDYRRARGVDLLAAWDGARLLASDMECAYQPLPASCPI